MNKLPTQGAVVLVTASYNGTPPDNAVNFCQWLQQQDLPADAFKGVQYAVFGCGNREWASTFQAIPRLIDRELERHGAQRIYRLGDGDASDDFDGQFQSWYQPLWGAVAERLELDLGTRSAQDPQYQVEIVGGAQPVNPFVASFGTQAMKIMVNRELHNKAGAQPSERSTRHIEFALPEGVTYRAGDHLGIIASNEQKLVQRVATRFNFDHESKIILHQNGKRKTHLPIDEPIQVMDMLADYVELQDVASRSQIKTLAEHTQCPPDKKKLLALCGDDEASITNYRENVLTQHRSLIDLLEEFPACELPFNIYLQMLSPIRPRYYSISSSPLAEPRICSITVGVISAPARSGHGDFQGLCSGYLARQAVGDVVYGFVRDTKSAFRLVENAATPIIMVGPGTGLAPYRGFLQERAAQKAQGKEIGQSLLFFGCRHPEQDFIYRDELKACSEQGITDLEVGFSRWEGHPKQYVQDQIRNHSDEVWQLIQDGAVIYICGDASAMAPQVKQTFAELYQARTQQTAEEANQWLNDLSDQGRYLVDVWASN